MPSSTSPFRKWRLLGGLLVTAVLAAGGSAWYMLALNPEIRHFKGTHAIKRAWASRLSGEHDSKVVVYGGSSCEFSINGERLLEKHSVPCANLGRGAGMGAVVLTMAALEEVRPGDTLIIALEPALLTDPLELPNLGIQFSVAVGQMNWIRNPLTPVIPASRPETLLALRPGGQHVFTMMGKLLRGRPLYRYRLEDMHPSGFNQTPLRLEIDGPPGHRIKIPEDAIIFLHALKEWCDEREVRVAYSLPWGYTPEEKVKPFQRENAQFLLQIINIIDVLKDERIGAYTRRDHFSDTAWHLTEEGASLRTDEFGNQVKNWITWSKPELQTRALALRSQPEN